MTWSEHVCPVLTVVLRFTLLVASFTNLLTFVSGLFWTTVTSHLYASWCSSLALHVSEIRHAWHCVFTMIFCVWKGLALKWLNRSTATVGRAREELERARVHDKPSIRASFQRSATTFIARALHRSVGNHSRQISRRAWNHPQMSSS